MPKYYTIQGDTWDMISLKAYNDEKYMHILLEANPAYNDIVVFPGNIEIEIPEFQRSAGPANAAGPVWKRR